MRIARFYSRSNLSSFVIYYLLAALAKWCQRFFTATETDRIRYLTKQV